MSLLAVQNNFIKKRITAKSIGYNTFKFHKVVRQQNSGAVEDFILAYSTFYLWIQK